MGETTFDQMGYMLGKLDTTRDTQVRQDGLLERILMAVETRQATTTKTAGRKLFSRVLSLPPFWQSMIAGGLFWTVGICTRSYLEHGGKPLELIEAVLKLVL